MSFMTIVSGDIIAAGQTQQIDYLLQQCNCLTCLPHGLSKSIATAWPLYGNVYGGRTKQSNNLATESSRPEPGTVSYHAPPPGTTGPTIACLYAQWKPGKVGAPFQQHYPEMSDGRKDSKEFRLACFQKCLRNVAVRLEQEERDGQRIGIPFQIGCGLAGGDWPTYLLELEKFAQIVSLPEFGNHSVHLYKL